MACDDLAILEYITVISVTLAELQIVMDLSDHFLCEQANILDIDLTDCR